MMKLERNNNASCIRKVAKSNVAGNRLYSLFTVLTILLAISLTTGITLVQQGKEVKEQKILENMQQVTIGNLNMEQISSLEKDASTECVLPYKNSNSFMMGNTKIEAAYYEPSEQITTYQLTDGNIPTKYNEIVIDKNMQSALGLSLKLGDNITFELPENKQEEFKIVGFVDNAESGTYYFYVSREYAEKGSLFADIPFAAMVRINHADEMGLPDFESVVYQLASDYEISRSHIYFNSHFTSSLIKGSGIGGILLAALFIAAASAVVIYSIFYLSVSNRVSQIGQFQTIGMTEKQLKKMIRLEGGYLSAVGIPIGLFIGVLFAYFIEPQGMTLLNIVITCIAVAVVGVLIVQFSIRKPGKIASRISPIEAARYSEGSKKKQKEKQKKHKRLSPFVLAKENGEKDRLKQILTISSLAIGGLLFIVGTTFISSWNTEAFARNGNLEQGEFYIAFDHDTLVNPKPYGVSEYQINQPFSDALLSEIENIDGVSAVYKEYRTAGIIEYGDSEMEIPIIPISEENKEEVMDTLGSEWTYEKLVENDAMIILGTDTQTEVYHTCPKVGENITFHWFDGTEHTTTLMIAGSSKKSMSEGYYLTPETIKKFWGDMDLTASLSVKTSDYKNTGTRIEDNLIDILSEHSELAMETLRETQLTASNTIENTRMQVYGLSAFVILFSVLNLINTLISRISTRRKELAMLESIGMEQKQIKKMLFFESTFLAIPNILITGVLGTLLGYVLVTILNTNGLSYFQYVFPTIPLLLYIVSMVVLPVVISSLCLKIQSKSSLVERIRTL